MLHVSSDFGPIFHFDIRKPPAGLLFLFVEHAVLHYSTAAADSLCCVSCHIQWRKRPIEKPKKCSHFYILVSKAKKESIEQ
jgi:hypothetical protein